MITSIILDHCTVSVNSLTSIIYKLDSRSGKHICIFILHNIVISINRSYGFMRILTTFNISKLIEINLFLRPKNFNKQENYFLNYLRKFHFSLRNDLRNICYSPIKKKEKKNIQSVKMIQSRNSRLPVSFHRLHLII